MRFLRAQRLLSLGATIALIFSLLPQASFAARLTGMTDAVTSHVISTTSNHSIAFTAPTGVDASSDTITLDFASFSLTGVGVGDVDLSHGPTTGNETAETLASSAAAGVWGVSFSGTTITFTAPTDAASGEIAASDRVNILIGTHASGGVNRITNPSSAGEYELVIAGTFGDEGRIGLAVAESQTVDVSATVPATSTPDTPPGPGPGDITPPAVINVYASTTSFTTVLITWQTDEPATSIVKYGHDIGYTSGTVSDVSYVLNHSVTVTGLIPCATYHYRVFSADWVGNVGTSLDDTFTMPCDTVPPIISNIQAVNITDASAMITWDTNEPASSVVEYGLTSAYGSTGSVLGFVTGHAVPLAGLLPGTTYHYRVLSTDPSGNVAVSGDRTFVTTSDTTPPANVQLFATPGNTTVQLSWIVLPDPDYAGVRLRRKIGGFPTHANDGVLIYQGGATSFVDTGLTNGVTYYYGAYAYDLTGNISSGALASATPSAHLPPPPPPPVIPPFPPGVVPPGPGVTSTPSTPGVTLTVQLFGSHGRLPLAYGSDGTIGVLAGSDVLVRVPADSMNGTPSIVAFMLNGNRYLLTYDAHTNSYSGTLTAPSAIGLYGGMGQVIFTDGRSGAVGIVVRVRGPGRVFERPLVGGQDTPIAGATVRLFRFDTEAVPWDGSAYGQDNPIHTDAHGQYAFQVPPGRYYVEVKKEGYWTYFSPPLFVDGNVFGIPVELILMPLPPDAVILPTATPLENVVALVRNLGDRIVAWLKLIRQFLDASAVRGFANNVLTPLVLVMTLLNAAAAIPLFHALAFLQYLFTEPLLMLGRRKRRRWGVVYNAYTKTPVDLAIVRLIHAPSGLIVQTRVTDARGRFYFIVTEGQYRIEVVKPGYHFPSTYVDKKDQDHDFPHPYFGDRITIAGSSVITVNAPLDPLVPAETGRQILTHEVLHRLQHIVASSGLVLSGLIFLIFPSMILAGIVLLHVLLYVCFRRLHRLPRPADRGVIYDASSQKPVAWAIVRLYEARFNRLLETQVTDRGGRYGFLAGNNAYYLTVDANGYRQLRQDVKMEQSKGEQFIAQNFRLERTGRSSKGASPVTT